MLVRVTPNDADATRCGGPRLISSPHVIGSDSWASAVSLSVFCAMNSTGRIARDTDTVALPQSVVYAPSSVAIGKNCSGVVTLGLNGSVPSGLTTTTPPVAAPLQCLLKSWRHVAVACGLRSRCSVSPISVPSGAARSRWRNCTPRSNVSESTAHVRVTPAISDSVSASVSLGSWLIGSAAPLSVVNAYCAVPVSCTDVPSETCLVAASLAVPLRL